MAVTDTGLSPSANEVNRYWEWAFYNDVFYCASGDKNYKIYQVGGVWTGAEVGSGGTKPEAMLTIRCGWGRLFGIPFGNRRSLRYSEPTTSMESWPAANDMVLTSEGGEATGLELWERDWYIFLNRNIISVPFATDPADYAELDLGTGWGCVAPHTLRRCGSFGLVCASDSGIRIFPSQEILSGPIQRTWEDLTEARRRLSYGFYDPVRETYNILVSTGETWSDKQIHNQWWVYDLRRRLWTKNDIFPRVVCGCAIDYVSGGRVMLHGSYNARIFKSGYGDDAGIGGVAEYTGTITSVGSATVMNDTGATFPTAGYGLQQMPVYIIGGTAIGQRRTIVSNTATQITVETATSPAWVAGDTYIVGCIRGRLVSPWLHMGDPQRYKRFHDLRLSINSDAVNKNYRLDIYTEFSETAVSTITGTFTSVNPVIPMDAAAKHLKIRLDVFSYSSRPAIRSMRLSYEQLRYL